MAPNNSITEQNAINDFNMEPSQYFRLVVESLSHVQTTVQLLRTAVTTLYEHASFEPNKKIQMPNMMQLNNSIVKMSNGNVLLKPTEAQTTNLRGTTNLRNEDLQHSTGETIRYSRDFIDGLSKENDGSLIKAGCNTYTNILVNAFNNHTANSEQFAYGSVVINNTDDILKQIHQMENEMNDQNGMVAGKAVDNNGPSTEVNVENDVIITSETEPGNELPAAPATNNVGTVEEKDKATMTNETDQVSSKKPVLPFKKQRVVMSTEKVLQIFRHKGIAAARSKIQSFAGMQTSSPCANRVVKRRSTIQRVSFERNSRSIKMVENPKPFKCSVDGCSYAGARKTYLTAHMKRHNKGMHEQVQMENEMSDQNETVAGKDMDNNRPSTEVNEGNDVIMTSEIGTEIKPGIAPEAAPATVRVGFAQEKDDAAKMRETDQTSNGKIVSPIEKQTVAISTEKVHRILRHRRISIRRSSVVKQKKFRASFERNLKSNSKPFKCAVDGCSYAGARKPYLTAHMKRHEKNKLID